MEILEVLNMEESPLQLIEKSLIKHNQGTTIQQLIEDTGLARGTVKTYLEELQNMGRVHEQEYGQNTKVFFLNGKGEFQQTVQMNKAGILFIDVFTDPWKQPFIRVKFKNNNREGAIFVQNEDAVDELIGVLQKAKPQLKKYRDMVAKLPPTPTQES